MAPLHVPLAGQALRLKLTVDVSSAELVRGRDAYSRYAWKEAYEELSQADDSTPLGGADLELLAVAAHMLGQDAEAMQLYERAHQAHRNAGDVRPAIRCAIWLGINLALRGDVGPATGWLGRAQRMLDRDGIDGAERGYLLLPVMFQHEAVGDYEGAAATAAEAVAIGERFRDADLVALAVHAQGSVLIKDGRVREGLGLLDEAMNAGARGYSAQRMGPRHEGFVATAKGGNIDLLLHGDSITDWWVLNDDSKQVFQKYFGNIRTANFAIAGDNTQGGLWGLKNGEGQGFQPKAVMLMIGTNNTGTHTGPEIAEGIGAVVLELRQDFPDAKILLLAVFPLDLR